MDCSPNAHKRKIVVDSIHGDIEVNDLEWKVIDTASFQRLRFIKQLGMGHLVYPNATHTRFAHSLGALATMCRILRTVGTNLNEDQKQDLRLAALLHDVGHYPYSHLMEGVDNVKLAEEFIHDPNRPKRTLSVGMGYPKHEKLGRLIVTEQADLVSALGGPERAERIASIFTRSAVDGPHWCNLVSSSLDMDRIDYLLRDAQAAGVPYGSIDINYLLNSLLISPNNIIGVDEKALPAAEQYLLARYFMHRTVYWHKTTYAFEEAARQLLRRIRDSVADKYALPKNESDVKDLMKSPRLRKFTDSFLDQLIAEAALDTDDAIRMIATCLLDRRPPKLLREVCDLRRRGESTGTGGAFRMNCKHRLRELAEQHNIALWRFMYCESNQLKFEKRGHEVPAETARNVLPQEADELIKVFCSGEPEPKALVDVDHSIIRPCADYTMQLFRLYVIDDRQTDRKVYEEIKASVRAWSAD